MMTLNPLLARFRMTHVFDEFRKSNLWHSGYDLPLFPGLNNPFIYGAYALKVMSEVGLSLDEKDGLMGKWERFVDSCRIEPGLFNRWPDGGGGGMSHDELMGLAYLSPIWAKEILAYLEKTDGLYCNKADDAKEPDAEIRFNVYRFPFMKPFLKARAGYSLSPFTQLQFAASLFWDMLETKKLSVDPGGRLKIWLMCEAMERGFISRVAVEVWRDRMRELGFTPRTELKGELGAFPILYQFAKDRF